MSVRSGDLLLRELADGRFHSGQQLADTLGISRTAVWKQVRRLESDLGLAISAVRGRGYRLASAIELLNEARIRAEFCANTRELLGGLHLLFSTDSTNGRASASLPVESSQPRVWLAEHQTAGRGRRGRKWISAFGRNLSLSLAWRFDLPMSELAGLSLMAGVVLAEVLQDLGLDGHTLKWPNDILVDGRKLAGILVEASGEAGGPATAVIGLGINLSMPAGHGAMIDQPWTDLDRAGVASISRNQLAGALVDGLTQACVAFSAERLTPFLPRWERFDKLRGQSITVLRGDCSIEGIYRGISPSGALLLENSTGRSEHHAGEVSLRKGTTP